MTFVSVLCLIMLFNPCFANMVRIPRAFFGVFSVFSCRRRAQLFKLIHSLFFEELLALLCQFVESLGDLLDYYFKDNFLSGKGAAETGRQTAERDMRFKFSKICVVRNF